MSYIRFFDYIHRYQEQNIRQWCAADVYNYKLLQMAERAAIEEVRGYIVQRYEIDAELTDTTAFANSAIYKANARVELNATAWVAGVYAVGAYVSFTDGKVYRCIQITVAQSPTDAAYWTAIGDQNEMFYIQFPYPVFDQNCNYMIGDKVFWKDKIYTALLATMPVGHQEALQDVSYENVRTKNVYPDDRTNGKTFWGVGVAYSVTGLIPNFTTASAWSNVTTYTAGTRVSYAGLIWKALTSSNLNNIPGEDITNWQSETWVAGDSRDAIIVRCITDLAINSVMPRISPRGIGSKFKEMYEWSIDWLKDVALGNFTPRLPAKQELRGNRIRWGGDIKKTNGY